MKVLNVTKRFERLTKVCRHASACVAAVLALGVLSACDGKDEPINGNEGTDGHDYITMIVRTSGAASRAEGDEGPTWGDFYNAETGNLFENHINPQLIHVAVYDADGNTIQDLYSGRNDKKVMIQSISDKEGLYYIYFDVSGLGMEKGKEYIASVIVNYEGTPIGSMLDDGNFSLSTLTGPGTPVAGENYYRGAIPMFGFIRWTFGNYSFSDEHAGFPSIGEIDLIRSVCKIEVQLADKDNYPRTEYMTFPADKKPRLSYVNGRQINNRGHMAPQKAKWLKPGMRQTKDLSFEDSFYEQARDRWTSPTSEHLYFQATANNERCCYIYLPEASGASMTPNLDALRLTVTINYQPPGAQAQTITGTLFPSIPYDETQQKYPNGTDFNNWKLIRNHIYRFTITDFVDETSLKYQVSESGNKTVEVPDFD